MSRSLILAALLVIPGCSDPETEPLIPGNRCEIVAWVKSPKLKVRLADFYDQAGPLTKLRPQTRVVVVAEKPRRRGSGEATERVMIKVLNGPLEGHVGFVFRGHLRKKSGPIPKTEKPKEPEQKPDSSPEPAPTTSAPKSTSAVTCSRISPTAIISGSCRIIELDDRLFPEDHWEIAVAHLNVVWLAKDPHCLRHVGPLSDKLGQDLEACEDVWGDLQRDLRGKLEHAIDATPGRKTIRAGPQVSS
jgi:hypothetical protein